MVSADAQRERPTQPLAKRHRAYHKESGQFAEEKIFVIEGGIGSG